jgi:hypothetical protein
MLEGSDFLVFSISCIRQIGELATMVECKGEDIRPSLSAGCGAMQVYDLRIVVWALD